MHTSKFLLPLLLSLSSLMFIGTNAYAEYYVYKHKDGTTWYTDKNMPTDSYKLIATIGRPTASASCRGTTKNSLEDRAKDHEPVIRQYSDLYGV